MDSKSVYATEAKYRLFKNQFYDSFTDNPLKPLSQSRDELATLLQIGETLLQSKAAVVNQEEVKFIQAIHILQAIDQQLISAAEGRKKFKQLMTDLRNAYPQSLKALTLEALGASY
jgi:carbamoylphosphate synthase large subunit